jgi:hypothetical protein
MSNLHTNKRSMAAESHRGSRYWAIAAAVAIGAVVGCLIVGRIFWAPPTSAARMSEPNSVKGDSASSQPTPELRAIPDTSAPIDRAGLIDDDGQTQWASPTDGPPLDLAYSPPGAQVVILLRPHRLASHPEGEKVRAALGPLGERAIQFVERTTNLPFDRIERLVVAFQTGSDGQWQPTLVVQAAQSAIQRAKEALTPAAPGQHAGEDYTLVNNRAYYFPRGGDAEVQVVAPAEAIEEIIELAGDPPPLRRDIERLLSHTDADRHLTMVFAPNALFSDGRVMFQSAMTTLRDPLFWYLGDELSAAALSLHWDENFFVELVAIPTLDTSPERAARILIDRLRQVSGRLEQFVAGRDAQPHGRQLVDRLPEMVGKLERYTRSGFEPDHAALRCYLPAVAGHNLLMAAELAMADSAAASRTITASKPAPASVATTRDAIAERLQRPTSLRFARDTLEAALEQLSQEIGVSIVISGPALQAEGITKNQSFGIDLQNQPAGDILVEILRLANPDKSAIVPADARQKLVYVIAAPDQGRPAHIVVTTRTAATEPGDELPPVFTAGQR